MNLIYEIVETTASFVEIFIAYQIIFNIFFKNNKTKLINEFFFSFIGMLLIRACNIVNIFSLITVMISAIYICITSYIMYKISIIKILGVTGVYILFMSYFDFLVMSTLAYCLRSKDSWDHILFSAGWPRIFMIIFIKITWILLYLRFRTYLRKYSITKRDTYMFIPISAIGICSSFPMATYAFQSSEKMFIIIWLLMITMLLLSFFTIYFIISYTEEHAKTISANLNSTLAERKFQEIQILYENNSKLYHDLNNHLTILYQLLEESDLKGAQNYLCEVSEPIHRLSQKKWTKNTIVNVILNVKANIMEHKNICFDYNVDIPVNIPIQNSDLCTILANLLDNAIEATEKVLTQKKVELLIKKINNFLLIKISNTYDMKVKLNSRNQLPMTTKCDKNLHGFGLRNVETTVKKYNGSMSFSPNTSGYFIVKIILFFDSDSK